MRDAGGVSRQKAEVGGVRPSNAADDYIGEDGEDDDDDDETEAFKDEIMKQLEEKAFSVEEAHNILTIQCTVDPSIHTLTRTLLTPPINQERSDLRT